MSQTTTWGAMHRDSQPQSTCQGFSTEAEQIEGPQACLLVQLCSQ